MIGRHFQIDPEIDMPANTAELAPKRMGRETFAPNTDGGNIGKMKTTFGFCTV